MRCYLYIAIISFLHYRLVPLFSVAVTHNRHQKEISCSNKQLSDRLLWNSLSSWYQRT